MGSKTRSQHQAHMLRWVRGWKPNSTAALTAMNRVLSQGAYPAASTWHLKSPARSGFHLPLQPSLLSPALGHFASATQASSVGLPHATLSPTYISAPVDLFAQRVPIFFTGPPLLHALVLSSQVTFSVWLTLLSTLKRAKVPSIAPHHSSLFIFFLVFLLPGITCVVI